MTVYAPLSPVSAGIYAALNVAGLLTVAPGGVHDDLPQSTAYPCVLFEVAEEDDSAFGSRPGSGPGSMSRITLRVHVYSQSGGMKECQTVMAKVKELLRTAPAASGFSVWDIWFESETPFGDEVLLGVKVKELVGQWWIAVEEA